MPSKFEKIVPDTSIIIDGYLSKKLGKKEITVTEILIHEAVLAELEHQANQNKSVGSLGLVEIEKLREIADKFGIKMTYAGQRPRISEIRFASLGEIDAMIRQLAYAEDAILFTADKVQARVAKAKGINVYFVEFKKKSRKLLLENYFDKITMSVHLRENVLPYAKKGVPGNWRFIAVGKQQLKQGMLKKISAEVIEETNIRKDSFVEIERPGSTIVQLGLYRIVITKPPFSDGWEITAVRPVKHLKLSDYKLTEKLMDRITAQAEGVLIAGAPGMGKSTFAAALAEFYAGQNKIVKTVEAPRDLVLPDKITQYAISHGDAQEIHDILLLSRPDFTFFDEMRNTNDFMLFADLRLAGIGFIGVVHATNPIDAIQRFVGRIELGVIPQVIDTVIFIKDGMINKVLSLKMVVKVPSGMTEADLARPVVVVNDFETKKLEFELYSYGEQTVVVPVLAEEKQSPAKELAKRQIEKEMKKYVSECNVEVLSEHKCRVYVPSKDVSRLIGKQGKNITEIEKRIGIGIDVDVLEKKTAEKGQKLRYNISVGKKNIVFDVEHKFIGEDVDILVNNDYLLTAKVGKKSNVKIRKNNKIGRIIIDAVNMGEKVELMV